MNVVLDTHVAWWDATNAADLSDAAKVAIDQADDVYLAAASWYELAWLLRSERLIPPRGQTRRQALETLSTAVITIPLDYVIAHRAVSLLDTDDFPRDPADGQILATAMTRGLPLITADQAIRRAFPTHCVW